MLSLLGSRQKELLHLLLKKSDGLTIDSLADDLGITRTAVRQHLATLERDGFVARAERRSTGGRPGQLYRLAEAGRALFPKRYSWFSALLLESVRKEQGPNGLEAWLAQIARTLVPALKDRVSATDLGGRVAATVELLGELGYEAEATAGPNPVGSENDQDAAAEDPAIVATNCPYHDLAVQLPEVCTFDLVILQDLLETEISHESCMAWGDQICRFRARKHAAMGGPNPKPDASKAPRQPS